ncbi:Ubiquitin fusion degradation protein 1 [Cyphellophora attinorum]|uniref:Ubiquitin fusion degradation protein 1 n=1 Tax=Cyphellophora attinorum TaxID=1664694 RepID=A0A0N1NWV3_9EURO|nr:Ubiquitin fusion degradation protein 1 [Phialophora attinorum]KPI36625.1 Ubiquitin fusion degradation protein 1 [Phialophora attinorum]
MYGYGRPPTGASRRRFDEYYRCYPVAMLNGPDRSYVNYGGKVFLPPSALQKLTMMHIAYPMVFEVINQDKMTHAGVLEFVAEEGRIYLPWWMMNRLGINVGDIIQVKSTDLPPGNLIKLKPQSTAFLDISDPRVVLENAFRGFSCLTKGDVFQFSYNDSTYDMLVEAVQPETEKMGIVTMETDLKVEFSAPVGYVEPERQSGTSTPASIGKKGGHLHAQGTMAQSINYSSIAPGSTEAAAGARAMSSNFLTSVIRSRKPRRRQHLIRQRQWRARVRISLVRKLFFGYEIKPLKKKGEDGEELGKDEKKPFFQGQGQTLRPSKKGK